MFSDGITVKTDGTYRALKLKDGWYVVGEGILAPVGTRQEAIDWIKELRSYKGAQK
tara:strand:+ start:189 stop:356 length:168 start_codon:yes stop_codon:yes gene_type:complete